VRKSSPVYFRFHCDLFGGGGDMAVAVAVAVAVAWLVVDVGGKSNL